MASTRVRIFIDAPRAAVYAALLDPRAVQRWMVPTGMRSEVHTFEPHEGGTFRISLTYAAPTGRGKTTAQTDTFRGRFARLVPNERVVQLVEFETTDPAMQGEMTITYTLQEAEGGGTELSSLHEGLPRGVSPEHNDLGTRISLGQLKALVEGHAAGER